MSGWNNQGDGRGDQQHPHEFTKQEQYAYQCQQLRDAFEIGGLDAADPRNFGYYSMAYPGQQNPFLSYQIPAAPYGGGYQYNTGGSGMYPSTGYNSGATDTQTTLPLHQMAKDTRVRRHLQEPTTSATLVTMDHHTVEGILLGAMVSSLISMHLSTPHPDSVSSLNTHSLTQDIPPLHLNDHLIFYMISPLSLAPAMVARSRSYMPALPAFGPLPQSNLGVIKPFDIHTTPNSLRQQSRWKKGRWTHGRRSQTRGPISTNLKTIQTLITLCG
jgi:hypothetical protein